jgi:predicted NBD/HSP70 family sugar kinase
VLRAINERTLFDALRAAGTTSRAELARSTGLSKPTVSAALANLERAGLVRPTGETAQGYRRGRAALLYEPDPTAGYVVGIDIGRQWIRAAVAGLDGTPAGRQDQPNKARSAAAIVRAAAGLARSVVSAAGIGWSQVVHVVVGGPGVIDSGSHRVRYAANLPGWEQAGLVDRLRTELGTSLDMVNDADLAALGEYALGAGMGCSLFAYLWIGTGVGAGYVIDGRLFRGAQGAAGELGYLPFYPLPVPGEQAVPGPAGAAGAGSPAANPAGNAASSPPGDATPSAAGDAAPSAPGNRRGVMEDAIAADGVVRLARALGMPDATSAKQVFDAARGGDASAGRVVMHEAARIAHAVAALAAALDPALVVLGGGIGRNTDVLLAPLQQVLATLTPLHPRVVPAVLGDDAVLLGALSTAADTARDQVFEARCAALA